MPHLNLSLFETVVYVVNIQVCWRWPNCSSEFRFYSNYYRAWSSIETLRPRSGLSSSLKWSGGKLARGHLRSPPQNVCVQTSRADHPDITWVHHFFFDASQKAHEKPSHSFEEAFEMEEETLPGGYTSLLGVLKLGKRKTFTFMAFIARWQLFSQLSGTAIAINPFRDGWCRYYND